VLCGDSLVRADTVRRGGPQIALRVVVLKATGKFPRPDPLVFLAGGPGVAATESAVALSRQLSTLRQRRDVVLIDPRGTGGSNRADCELGNHEVRARALLAGSIPSAALKQCIERMGIEPRWLTTFAAADDVAEITLALGYRQLNIYGVSYGSRVGLVFLKRHQRRIRTLILQGVARSDESFLVTSALDSQAALDRLLSDCRNDARCSASFPELAEDLQTVLREAAPDRLFSFRLAITAALYNSISASGLPLSINRAAQGRPESLLNQGMILTSSAAGLAAGMYLSIVCNEDVPRISRADLKRLQSDTFIGVAAIQGLMKACENWPRSEIPDSAYAIPRTRTPVLLLSGEVDPATGPKRGESLIPFFSNARHVVLRATGHSGAGSECAAQMVSAFVEAGTPKSLDATCAGKGVRPPFVLERIPAGVTEGPPDSEPPGRFRGTWRLTFPEGRIKGDVRLTVRGDGPDLSGHLETSGGVLTLSGRIENGALRLAGSTRGVEYRLTATQRDEELEGVLEIPPLDFRFRATRLTDQNRERR
jgi:pimeloyl-ACP methyl ester carboxylesterase